MPLFPRGQKKIIIKKKELAIFKLKCERREDNLDVCSKQRHKADL